ncbi:hypothetical protein C8Q76DRAFT_748479 [Earliella scabrosa]|nr:hypothetical protein C8Q76DRAFT_748479 [Earliella scabrosa]
MSHLCQCTRSQPGEEETGPGRSRSGNTQRWDLSTHRKHRTCLMCRSNASPLRSGAKSGRWAASNVFLWHPRRDRISDLGQTAAPKHVRWRRHRTAVTAPVNRSPRARVAEMATSWNVDHRHGTHRSVAQVFGRLGKICASKLRPSVNLGSRACRSSTLCVRSTYVRAAPLLHLRVHSRGRAGHAQDLRPHRRAHTRTGHGSRRPERICHRQYVSISVTGTGRRLG